MESAILPYQSSLINYRVFGVGKKLLFCFHGYGESSESFAILEKELSPAFTMVAIDLPFHGGTQWAGPLIFTPRNLLEILNSIVARMSIEFDDIGLLGFSMGARVALALFELIPEKTRQLVLLAPDGLKENFWYSLGTQNAAGRSLFSYTMKHPGWFKLLLKTAKKAGVANQSIYKFAASYLQENDIRTDLYRRWVTMRAFRPDRHLIKTEILKHKIPVTLVYGQYDRIISPNRSRKFQKSVEPFCRVLVLACGHQVLQEKNASTIIQLLKS